MQYSLQLKNGTWTIYAEKNSFISPVATIHNPKLAVEIYDAIVAKEKDLKKEEKQT